MLNRQATDVSSRFLVLVACTIGTRGRLDPSARVFRHHRRDDDPHDKEERDDEAFQAGDRPV